MLLKEWVDINKENLAVMKNAMDINCISAVECIIESNFITEDFMTKRVSMDTEVFYVDRTKLKVPIKGVKITFDAKRPNKRKPETFVYYMGLEAVDGGKPGQA